MKIKNFLKIKNFKLTLISSLVACLFSHSVIAQTLPLYEQPNTNAKVVGSADLSVGIIPIFKPQGDWIKVADPRNGNVGWIKSSEINKAKGTSKVTYTQKIISNGQVEQQQDGYQVIQYGMPPDQNTEQLNAFLKRMQIEQKTLQNTFQNILKEMNNLFQTQINMWKEHNPTQETKPIETKEKSMPNNVPPSKVKSP